MKKIKSCLILILIIIGSIFIYLINKKEYLSSDDIIGVYVNNELSEDIPSKDEALFQKAICDNDNVKVSWDSDNWGLLISNMNTKVKCNLYFYSGQTVFNFDYTGSEQTFTAPISGTYKLETWGAQGSSNWYGAGGYGGYSVGDISLNANIELFINVGGKKGYNGGNYMSGVEAPGGGATHISTITGLLSNLENFKSNILIVSGGGGAGERENGGSGGGYIGGTGYVLGNSHLYFGTGGTQSSGGTGVLSREYTNNLYDVNGSFGTGGIGVEKTDNGPNGGGGYYGGGATTLAGGAGGGSGYIGNSLLTNKVMYCYNCEESSEESTKTISTTCSEETQTVNCSKKENGYVRITLISINE